jgi:hypothetical protein
MASDRRCILRSCGCAIALAAFAICIGSTLFAPLPAGELPPPVEPSLLPLWSDPANLVITGNSSFSRSEILRALRLDIDTQMAASIDDGGTDYASAVRRVVVDGYKDAGFADVAVNCRIDRGGENTLLKIN